MSDNDQGFDLRLMSLESISGIPTWGVNQVIAANVKGVLHFRIFDAEGKRVVDTDETSLPTQAGPIAELRKQLENLWPSHVLIGPEKNRIIAEVMSIVGQTHDQDRGDGKRPANPDGIEYDYIFKKADFDNLNKEILDNSNKIYQIIQISFTSVPVFLAGVLALRKGDGERGWWFVSITSLLVFAIIIPSVLLVTSSLKSTVRVSQYLLLRYPSSGKLKGWEYYIQFFRVTAPKNKYRFFGNSLTWIFAGLSSLTILVSLVSFLEYNSQLKDNSGASEHSSFRILIYIIFLVLCMTFAFFSILGLRKSLLKETFYDYDDRWKSIDDAIKGGITLDDIRKGRDLQLMSSVKDVSGIPPAGKNLIIVAAVDKVLHFRIFDLDGKVVLDTDETRLAEQAGQIEDLSSRFVVLQVDRLKKQLESLWPPHELTGSQRGCVITTVTSIASHTHAENNQMWAWFKKAASRVTSLARRPGDHSGRSR